MRLSHISGCTLLLLLAGCDNSVFVPESVSVTTTPDAVPARQVSGEEGAAHATSVAAVEPEQIKLKVGDEQALEAMIANHKGKVVFVDYWATWCHPCVEYFPHTVEMSRKYKDQGLVTIAVTFDAVEEEANARKYLAEQGVDFENLLCSYDAGPEAFEKFGIEQVPHFRLYDREGKLVKKWDDKPEDAEAAIEGALAAQATSPE